MGKYCDNSQLISIGYPIGIDTTHNDKYGRIETKEKIFYVDLPSYSLWNSCYSDSIFCKDHHSIVSPVWEKIDLGQSEVLMNKLIEKQILIPVNRRSTLQVYENLKELRIVKCGEGIMYDENNGMYQMYINTDVIEIDESEYHIWMLANGTRSFKTIMNDLIDTEKLFTYIGQGLINSMMNLYDYNLIRFV